MRSLSIFLLRSVLITEQDNYFVFVPKRIPKAFSRRLIRNVPQYFYRQDWVRGSYDTKTPIMKIPLFKNVRYFL